MYTICVILQFNVHVVLVINSIMLWKVNVYLSSDKTVSALMTLLHYKSNELIDTYNVEI